MASNPILPTEDITLYDFMFNRPLGNQPWFLDAITGESRTPALLKERVNALALGLQKHLGLSYLAGRRHDPNYTIGPVVSIVSTNDVDFGTAIWASHLAGATVAPSNASGTVDELTHQLRLSGAQYLITHPTTLERALAAARAVGIKDDNVIVLARGKWADLYVHGATVAKTYSVDDQAEALYTIDELIDLGKAAAAEGTIIHPQPLDPARPRVAFLCFSWGTTGLPKAVVLSHRAVIADVLLTSATAVPSRYATPGDKALGVIPMSHMYGLLTLVHLCPHLGITSTLFPSLPQFEKFLNTMEKLKINHLFLAPPLINAFIKHPAAQGRDFSYFKTCLVAAAPLDAERENAFKALASPHFVLGQVFGMTEAAGLITGLPVDESPVSGSVGRPLPLTEVRVTDPDGNVLGVGGRGELRVKGPQLCFGYLDNEKANAETFDSEGFLLTGDEVEIREGGNLFVMDRLKQMIKTKGFQIRPAELEGHLLKHPFVKDVGVVGKPDERAGEVPVAFVVLTEEGQEAYKWGSGAVKEAIKAHVRENKSEYKWLDDVIFLDAIPKLPTYKILTSALKSMLPPSSVVVQYAKPDPVEEAPIPLPRDSTSSDGTHVPDQAPLLDEKKTFSDAINPQENGTDIEKGLAVVMSRDGEKERRFITEQAKLFKEKKAGVAESRVTAIREWLSPYRSLFIIIFVPNIVGIGYTLAHKWKVGLEWSATFSLSLVMAALCARSEVVIRVLYTVLLHIFKRWSPFWWRNGIATFLLNIGGIHSGAGFMGTLWLLTTMIELYRKGGDYVHPAILTFVFLATFILVLVCASAWPSLREHHHNVFENVHRYAGWVGLGFLWIVVGLADTWSVSQHKFIAHRLYRKPDMYIAVGLSILIFLPWFTYRKVPVKAEVLSNAVVLIRFPGGYRSGLFGRISRTPFKENHAFGIASKSPDSGEHYMVVVGQGDFTRGLIADPPTHLWTRMYKFAGLPLMTSFFRSGLYVVTGSAIGVALSIFVQRDPKSKWHMLWISGNIEPTYHATVLPDIHEAFKDESQEYYDEIITIWDTRVKGRPDIVALIEQIVRKHNLEVVFITSNPKGTADAIRGCKARGIHCHGPVWDS